MALMIVGLLLWSVVHFIPSLAPSFKASWKSVLGENGYMATFSLAIILSLALIVFGWRAVVVENVYLPNPSLRAVGIALMALSFILFGAAKQATRIKQYIRHPQLCSVLVWSAAHLVLNGDNRSVVLFSGMAVWAVLEMLFINRRDGTWVKPEIPAWAAEAKVLVIGSVVCAVFALIHPYIAGVPVL